MIQFCRSGKPFVLALVDVSRTVRIQVVFDVGRLFSMPDSVAQYRYHKVRFWTLH